MGRRHGHRVADDAHGLRAAEAAVEVADVTPAQVPVPEAAGVAADSAAAADGRGEDQQRSADGKQHHGRPHGGEDEGEAGGHEPDLPHRLQVKPTGGLSAQMSHGWCL